MVASCTPSALVDTADVRRVADALRDILGSTVTGFPSSTLFSRKVTVSLAVGDIDGEADAWSWPSEGVVALPIGRVVTWKDEELRRVMKHEITHVRMSDFIGSGSMQYWFSEGLAEWSAGGRACERAWILWIDINSRRASGIALPSLDDTLRNPSDRVTYDYLADVIEFVERAWPGVVSEGILIGHVRNDGVDKGLWNTLGVSISELQEKWHASLRGRTHTEPQIKCSPYPGP